ncbi:hypothetical protein HDU96_007556 [Phlyctochytrium bullatum]|nr:hypothetical protein HDU96_007556 [Phlyctochytrium bullatum]
MRRIPRALHLLLVALALHAPGIRGQISAEVTEEVDSGTAATTAAIETEAVVQGPASSFTNAAADAPAGYPPVDVVQRAAKLLTFNIAAPGGCLFQDADLSGNPSRNLAALWLRAAFHDSATYDPATGKGGADGSLNSEEELALPDNTGLPRSMAPRFLVNMAGNQLMTDADKIALGAVVTVQHCGGPSIPFRTGRADVFPKAANDYANLARNPLESLPSVTAKFQALGLSKLDMLVLVSGSHSLGGAHKAITPSVTTETFAPFDDTPGTFDNNIFRKILQGKCVLPIDCAFAQDADLLPYINLYATNQDAFFTQYAQSMEKMMGLTRSKLSEPVPDLPIGVHQNLAEGDLSALKLRVTLVPSIATGQQLSPYPRFSKKLPEWAIEIGADEIVHSRRLEEVHDALDNVYNPGRTWMVVLLIFPFVSLNIYFLVQRKFLFGQLVTIPFIILIAVIAIVWPINTFRQSRDKLRKFQEAWSNGPLRYQFNNVESLTTAWKHGITITLSPNPNSTEKTTAKPRPPLSRNQSKGHINDEPPPEVRIEGMDF